ncbi:MAG: hypothetical protein GF398_00620 [Chitinivibrionales bacterium]|nr:hypothetical protein [Chitinivibrionales bacterium]
MKWSNAFSGLLVASFAFRIIAASGIGVHNIKENGTVRAVIVTNNVVTDTLTVGEGSHPVINTYGSHVAFWTYADNRQTLAVVRSDIRLGAPGLTRQSIPENMLYHIDANTGAAHQYDQDATVIWQEFSTESHHILTSQKPLRSPVLSFRSGVLYVQGITARKTIVEILDAQGALLMRVTADGSTTAIAYSPLASGIRFVRVKTGDRAVLHKMMQVR